MTEFVPGQVGPAAPCDDLAAWGEPSVIVPQYIAKIKVEPEAGDCPPYYYSNAQIDNLLVTNTLGTASVTKVVGATGTFSGLVSADSISANSKAFNIPHPSPNKKGIRLWHGCLEGPEHAVYFRGRVKNTTEIALPSYWKDLIHIDSITVNLTPVGAHQNVIVKRWDEEKIYLQGNGGMPIDCFYHVYAERKDIDPLVVEQVDMGS